MAVMTTGINWPEKYFQQIEARLESLQHGLRGLREDQRALREEQRALREEMKTDYARLDAKIDGGLREVRRLQWGTLALLCSAVIGSLARIIFGV